MHACQHVVIFRSAAPACVRRLTKVVTIHNAEPVVHGQDRVSQVGKILILGVCIVVVVHVMEPEHHLPGRATMSKDQRWSSACLILRNKELAVDREPIAALERHLLRNDQLS